MRYNQTKPNKLFVARGTILKDFKFLLNLFKQITHSSHLILVIQTFPTWESSFILQILVFFYSKTKQGKG